MIRDPDHQPQSVEGLATEEEKPTKFWLASVLKTSPSTLRRAREAALAHLGLMGATLPGGAGWPVGSPASPQLDEEETAEADHDEDAADKPHEKERAKQRARLAAVFGALGPRQTLPVRGDPGVELGVVDASERPVLAELDICADEQRQQADHGEPEIADELEGDHRAERRAMP